MAHWTEERVRRAIREAGPVGRWIYEWVPWIEFGLIAIGILSLAVWAAWPD